MFKRCASFTVCTACTIECRNMAHTSNSTKFLYQRAGRRVPHCVTPYTRSIKFGICRRRRRSLDFGTSGSTLNRSAKHMFRATSMLSCSALRASIPVMFLEYLEMVVSLDEFVKNAPPFVMRMPDASDLSSSGTTLLTVQLCVSGHCETLHLRRCHEFTPDDEDEASASPFVSSSWSVFMSSRLYTSRVRMVAVRQSAGLKALDDLLAWR
mmetsp:Transcript_66322/g.186798  ORF Transcript_66322/g.186798 Transcript_66322/m.186798 type:complete len:210 (-) Transcript_66322:628-1257(-)